MEASAAWCAVRASFFSMCMVSRGRTRRTRVAKTVILRRFPRLLIVVIIILIHRHITSLFLILDVLYILRVDVLLVVFPVELILNVVVVRRHVGKSYGVDTGRMGIPT